jgi:hypothetical protein
MLGVGLELIRIFRMDPKRAVPRGEDEEKKRASSYETGQFKTKKVFVGGIHLETTKGEVVWLF